mgnify:CR=1 FL=1
MLSAIGVSGLKNKIVKRLLKNTYYVPYWKDPENKWRKIAAVKTINHVILLCERVAKYGADWAVFTDLLIPKSIPSDKYHGSLESAKQTFTEIIYEEMLGKNS